MNKILLINPPGISLGYNVGLCFLSAVLKKEGFHVTIIDLLNQPGNENKRLMQAKNFDIIGISIKTLVIDEAVRIMKKIKKINPNAVLTAGGVHISLDAYNFMKENPVFDAGFIKDSEQSFLDFVKGKPLEEIEGIVYRKNGEIIVNPKKNSLLNLDTLPFPDFDSFDIPLKIIGNYPLVTSRGCPYNCTYCTVQAVGKKWVPRTVDNLILELNSVKHRIEEFHIVDDNFTLKIERVKNFCRRLIAENFNIRWSCPNGIRADILDDELATLMKKSGCYLVNLGIESLDEKVFNNIQKGETLDDIKNAIKLLKSKDITVIGNFIIGLPGSTFDIDMKSVNEAKKLGLDVSLWYPLSIYPTTEVYDQYSKDSTIHFIEDWKKGFKYNFRGKPILSFEKDNYTKHEMIKMFYLANLKSKSYGILVDPKKSLIWRGFDLLGIILSYDPLHVIRHVYNAFSILVKYRKVY